MRVTLHEILAETDALEQNARDKLERKNLDFIVANDVSRDDIGFDSDHNAVTIFARNGDPVRVPRAGKDAVAESILDRVFGAVAAAVEDEGG